MARCQIIEKHYLYYSAYHREMTAQPQYDNHCAVYPMRSKAFHPSIAPLQPEVLVATRLILIPHNRKQVHDLPAFLLDFLQFYHLLFLHIRCKFCDTEVNPCIVPNFYLWTHVWRVMEIKMASIIHRSLVNQGPSLIRWGNLYRYENFVIFRVSVLFLLVGLKLVNYGWKLKSEIVVNKNLFNPKEMVYLSMLHAFTHQKE